MKVAIVGAGWAGMAAAVGAVKAGHDVTVFEASSAVGGRARALRLPSPSSEPGAHAGTDLVLDNGQHILIGAYTETLRLMRSVGLEPDQLLLRQPLAMPFIDGTGLQTPAWAAQWPAPLDALAAIATVPGWSWADRWSLLRAALGWQLRGFTCDAGHTVAQLCNSMAARVQRELIEPLCVSALNTPPVAASGQVFLRVLQDALFGIRGGSNLLLPLVDLASLFPAAAARWIAQPTTSHTPPNSTPPGQGRVQLGHRVQALRWQAPHWWVDGVAYDRVIWATSASNAAQALVEHASTATNLIANDLQRWARVAQALRFEAIATVYCMSPGKRLPHPMLALRSSAQHPAQFVFDRGQLGGPAGLWAFVVSASTGNQQDVQAAVMAQAASQLPHWGGARLKVIQTVVEKRATFACTPGLLRPAQRIAPALVGAGDYIQGPYPATLEGAVRSGLSAVQCL